MRTIYRNSLVFLILIIALSFCCAFKSMKQGDAVITMRDGQPCFSYPQDEEIKKRPYSFGYLAISEKGPVGRGGWEMQIARPDRRGLLDPNSPDTCIKYGGPHPGTKDIQHAEPLKMDTPYVVHVSVFARTKEAFYERNYSSNFCLTRDEKGRIVIVGADTNDDNTKYNPWKCLKPGGKPKRSFWERLFGK